MAVNLPIARLGDVVEVTGGATPSKRNNDFWGGEIPWVSPKDMKTFDLDSSQDLITEEGLRNSACNLIPAGIPLIVVRSGVLKHSLPIAVPRMPVALNQDLKALLPADGLLPRYLAFWLLGNEKLILATCSKKGATVESIVLDKLRALQIPLPSLKEQERIVEILDQADALRRQRREADELSKRIIPAIFHEMFGDPQNPPSEWEQNRIGALCERFSDGPFGSNLKSAHYADSGVRVIRLQNIGVGTLLDHDKAFIGEDHFSKLFKHECLPGDVLIGTMGDPNLRACIQPDSIIRALNKADCVQARVDPERATPEYLCWLLNHPTTLHLVPGSVQGQTRGRVSMGRIREALVARPPLDLQKKFSDLVRINEGICNEAVGSKDTIETLFQTLLHRAFDGSLTASWREAHAAELLQEMEGQSS